MPQYKPGCCLEYGCTNPPEEGGYCAEHKDLMWRERQSYIVLDMAAKTLSRAKNLLFTTACSSAVCIQDVLCYKRKAEILHFIRYSVQVELPRSEEEEKERKIMEEKGFSFSPKTNIEEHYVVFSGASESFAECSEEEFRRRKLGILTDLPEGWVRKSARHISDGTEERFLVDLTDFKKKTMPEYFLP